MPGPVVMVEYDPAWPSLYEAEKERVLSVAGQKISTIEHIGSTSVPGLGAKPIIDIMACVRDSGAADECVELLKPIGYTDITSQSGHAEWFYCLAKGPHTVEGLRSVYHLHLVKENSRHFEDYILFRDYLRTHPDVAAKYYKLKKKLAEKHRHDRDAYTESKTTFIRSVLCDVRKKG